MVDFPAHEQNVIAQRELLDLSREEADQFLGWLAYAVPLTFLRELRAMRQFITAREAEEDQGPA